MDNMGEKTTEDGVVVDGAVVQSDPPYPSTHKIFGWELLNNYGNYGCYGWGFSLFHVRNRNEHDIVVQVGPWKAMIRHAG